MTVSEPIAAIASEAVLISIGLVLAVIALVIRQGPHYGASQRWRPARMARADAGRQPRT